MTRRSPIYNYAAELAAACSDDYEIYFENYLARAEHECRGQLVNRAGRERNITGPQLLRGVGHHMRRRAYATRELTDHVAQNPLLTRTEFERQWLDSEIRGIRLGAAAYVKTGARPRRTRPTIPADKKE